MATCRLFHGGSFDCLKMSYNYASSYGGATGRTHTSYTAKLKEVVRNPDGTPKNTSECLFKVTVPSSIELVDCGGRCWCRVTVSRRPIRCALSGGTHTHPRRLVPSPAPRSLPELGEWDNPLPMGRDPAQPHIWTVAVTLVIGRPLPPPGSSVACSPSPTRNRTSEAYSSSNIWWTLARPMYGAARQCSMYIAQTVRGREGSGGKKYDLRKEKLMLPTVYHAFKSTYK